MASSADKPQTPAEVVDALGNWNDRYGHVFGNEDYQELCDVTFSVGEKIIRASRYVLGLRSDVFKKMLYGPLSHKLGDTITIKDVEPEIFLLLLKYIYTDKAELTLHNVLAAIYVAKKYNIRELEKMAVAFLKSNMTPDNVCTVFNAACFYENQDVEMRCLDVISAGMEAVIMSDSFTSLSYDNLLRIVKLDELAISDEEKLFEAILRWADAECERKKLEQNVSNKRKVLGDILFQIRFPTMDPELFVKGPVASGILNAEEQANILINHHKSKTLESIFPKKQRNYAEVVSVVCPVPVEEIDYLRGYSLSIGRADEFGTEFYLHRCDDKYCSNTGDNRGTGCCLNLEVTPAASCKFYEYSWEVTPAASCKFYENSWIEVINNDPQKSLRSFLNEDEAYNVNKNQCWYCKNIAQFRVIMDHSSGFVIDGRLRIKVWLMCKKGNG